MKKVVLFALLAASSVGGWAADYVGVSYGLSRLGACPSAGDCDAMARSMKLLAATDAPDRLKALSISSIEVSFAKMGNASERYSAPLPLQSQDNIDSNTPVIGQYTQARQATAMGLSLVSRHQLAHGLTFAARFGVAYTTSTRTTHLGVAYEDADAVLQPYQGRVQQVSASRLAPIIGASVEYELLSGTRLTTGVEMTRYSVAGDAAPYWQFHFGVQQNL